MFYFQNDSLIDEPSCPYAGQFGANKPFLMYGIVGIVSLVTKKEQSWMLYNCITYDKRLIKSGRRHPRS